MYLKEFKKINIYILNRVEKGGGLYYHATVLRILILK